MATVVVGAGTVGLACAYELARRGEDVTILDSGAAADGCSRGNAGWIVPSFSSPLPTPGLTFGALLRLLRPDGPLRLSPRALPALAPWLWRFRHYCTPAAFANGLRALATLNRETFELYSALEANGLQFEAHHDGVLFTYLSEEELVAAGREFTELAAAGCSVPRPLGRAEVLALEPALSDITVGGYLAEDEAHVRPESLNTALLECVRALGAEVRTGVTVTGAHRPPGESLRIVTTTGAVRADRLVIAAGAWSGALCARLGRRLPVQAGKGYSITFSRPVWSFRRATYLGDAHIACSPFEGALRFAGTMELAGIDPRLDPRRVRALQRAADRYLADPPQWSAGEAWAGLRPITPDGLPLIGRLPGRRDVLVATGHAMLGITLAPMTGYLIATMALSEADPDVARPFDPARFAR